MLNVTFSIAGEEQYVRAFEVMDGELRTLRPALEQTAKHLVQVVGEQFLEEGAHGLGTKWRALNPAYERWKDEHYPGRPMLVRTGAMRQAFLVDGTRQLDDTTLVWGVTDQVDEQGHEIRVRAAAHQSGEGVVPQRKIVALTSADRRGIDRIFVEYVNSVRHHPIAA